jgi:hypothetical protein
MRVEIPYHGQQWCGLLVDEVFYGLVLWKHTVGRPEHIKALQCAAQEAIAIVEEMTK